MKKGTVVILLKSQGKLRSSPYNQPMTHHKIDTLIPVLTHAKGLSNALENLWSGVHIMLPLELVAFDHITEVPRILCLQPRVCVWCLLGIHKDQGSSSEVVRPSWSVLGHEDVLNDSTIFCWLSQRIDVLGLHLSSKFLLL